MTRTPAYLAIGDDKTPLCGYPLHMHHGVTCGHRSLADALRAAKHIRDHFSARVHVIAGHCPEAAA